MKVSSVIKLLVSCGTAAFSLAEQRAMPTSINEICQKQTHYQIHQYATPKIQANL